MANNTEDVELREQLIENYIDVVLLEHSKEVKKNIHDGYNGEVWIETKPKIKQLIRNEKLKLLAEVRERVIGENDYQPGNQAPVFVERNRLARDGLRDEQRAALNKLEAEL